MLPITTRPRVTKKSGRQFFSESFGARQKKPYNLELPLDYKAGWVLREDLKIGSQQWPDSFWMDAAAVGNYPRQSSWDMHQHASPEIDRATNKAREKFISKMKSSASMGENIAQYRSTLDLVNNRLIDIGTIFASLLGGKTKVKNVVNSAAKRIKSRQRATDRSIRRAIKEPAKAWIEFHFVLEPAVKDVHEALKVLDQGVNCQRLKTKGFERFEGFIPNDLQPGYSTRQTTYSRNTSVTICGEPRVTDLATMSLASLGLTNLPLLAWQLLPWSWFVDWGANVSTYLEQLNDTAGISIDNASTTTVVTGTSICVRQAHYPWNPSYDAAYGYDVTTVTRGVQVKRVLTFPPVAFQINIPSVLSTSKALTALSLFTLMSIPDSNPGALERRSEAQRLSKRFG